MASVALSHAVAAQCASVLLTRTGKPLQSSSSPAECRTALLRGATRVQRRGGPAGVRCYSSSVRENVRLTSEKDNVCIWSSVQAKLATTVAALSLSAALQLAPISVAPSAASEYDVFGQPPPTAAHVVDDASVLNRVTKSDLKRLLTDLEEQTGYHVDIVTLRKITSKSDVFEFADQLLERWYPTVEEGDKKGLVVLVTTQKEGAVTGGPSFSKTIGDGLLEALVSENLPVLAVAEKYNEAMYSTAKRIVAKIEGEADIEGPKFQENKRVSNFKTKSETEEKRGQFTLVVGGLLVIAFVVPMAQYYAYVRKK